jgi:hypothetical protein
MASERKKLNCVLILGVGRRVLKETCHKIWGRLSIREDRFLGCENPGLVLSERLTRFEG